MKTKSNVDEVPEKIINCINAIIDDYVKTGLLKRRYEDRTKFIKTYFLALKELGFNRQINEVALFHNSNSYELSDDIKETIEEEIKEITKIANIIIKNDLDISCSDTILKSVMLRQKLQILLNETYNINNNDVVVIPKSKVKKQVISSL